MEFDSDWLWLEIKAITTPQAELQLTAGSSRCSLGEQVFAVSSEKKIKKLGRGEETLVYI